MSYLKFLATRLREPSTFAAIAAGLTAAQTVPDVASKTLVIGAALAGVLVPEAAKAGA
ncbi:hypothetical protein [Caballeronia sp. LZ016]|uniref:hypothetical protein n=1 Tax=Caballeronia sp. LZ016 TaxID=3038554 RepID=UPI00286557E2|nr:hypothetical protein [Caballeronia sp. LZ016]MDR5739487.1 hypothetical protein [Caballeronia sp. LZ016]